ncbi:hypothetical protein BXQ27_10905 [Klebsiella aerogenes]|nr:hypothetical protein BXQ27_10905 [Klebsiella aerogenes]
MYVVVLLRLPFHAAPQGAEDQGDKYLSLNREIIAWFILMKPPGKMVLNVILSEYVKGIFIIPSG